MPGVWLRATVGITYAQLRAIGLTAQEIKVWIRSGELIRARPRVSALGYIRSDLVARFWDAILSAGPGAYLSGASGAHKAELIAYPPREVIVATPRNCRSLPGIVVLQRRGNHGTGPQKRRDASATQTLQSHGLRVLRFDWADVHARAGSRHLGRAPRRRGSARVEEHVDSSGVPVP